MDKKLKKLFSDTAILGFGTFGSKLLVFFLMPFYTAWLSTSQYSTAELITGTANLIIPLACIGIANGIFRFAADREQDQAAVLSSSVALLGIGSLIFLALSPLLLLIDYFSSSVWLILLYVLSANLQSVAAQYVRAIDRTKLFALQGILNTLLTVGLNILFLAVWDMGVTGYVLSVILGNLVTTLFLIVAARLDRVFSFAAIDKRMMKELLVFSLPMVPTTICWLITDLSDRYMVTYFCGDAVNGVYSAAYKIPTLITLVSSIFMQAWQFSAVAESSDDEGCRRFYSDVFRGFLSVIAIGTAGLILFSRVLTQILLNETYFEAHRYMPTLLCAAALESVVAFLATVYMVKKKSMHSFLTAVLGTGLNLLLNLLLIPSDALLGGALGAAIATLVGYGAVLVARMIDAPRLIRFKLCLPRLTVSVALLLAEAAVMTLAGEGGWILSAVLTAAVAAINLPALLHSFLGLLKHRRNS